MVSNLVALSSVRKKKKEKTESKQFETNAVRYTMLWLPVVTVTWLVYLFFFLVEKATGLPVHTHTHTSIKHTDRLHCY